MRRRGKGRRSRSQVLYMAYKYICDLLGEKNLSDMLKFINLSTMIELSSMFIKQLNVDTCNT